MREHPLFEDDTFAAVIEPEGGGEATLASLLAWVDGSREAMMRSLVRNGALLLRGFAVADAADFERVCRAIAPELRPYVGGESPRTAVSTDVYTSTEYPAHLPITLHSEMSYARVWPSLLFFFCGQPAASGGETPIADTRRILQRVGPEVAARFEERGVMYLNNFHGGWGLGKSWQETFETDDRPTVERHLEQSGAEFRWSDAGLWTREVRHGVIRHPSTGERVWFNQADRWHVSSRGDENARKVLKVLGEDGLPRHARHGDGSAIDPADLEQVRAAFDGAQRLFDWRRGDLLILDNVLSAHGRMPFTGERQVLVAMA